MLLPLFALTLLLLMVSLVGNVRFLFFGRASGRNSSTTGAAFSAENSYLSMSPTTVRPNGVERIRLTINILSNEGTGVLGKKVVISKPIDVIQESIQDTTDTYGKAVIDFKSEKSGEYYIEAFVDGAKAGEGVKISFK